MAKKDTSNAYENNPFFIGLNGLLLFFKNARSVAIYAIVLVSASLMINTGYAVVDFVSYSGLSPQQQLASDREAQSQTDSDVRAFFEQDPGALAVQGVILASGIFLLIVVSMFLYGILEYSGARIALGKKAGLKESLAAVWADLGGYVWLNILITAKIFLWSLLLIIPGIIMATRYSLSGTVFFAEGKRGNQAIKRSLALTDGAWLTTFSGVGLWNILTSGVITPLLMPGIAAVLYRQYLEVTDSGAKKPNAHWLSILVPVVLIALCLMLIVVVGLAVLFIHTLQS